MFEFRALPLASYLLVSCMTLGKLLNSQVASLFFTYTMGKRICTSHLLGDLNQIMYGH